MKVAVAERLGPVVLAVAALLATLAGMAAVPDDAHWRVGRETHCYLNRTPASAELRAHLAAKDAEIARLVANLERSSESK